MARTTVKLPKLGDTADEVVILRWIAETGEQVVPGASLVLVETAKVEVEVPSPVAGILLERLVDVDDDVATGTALCVIET